MRGYLRVWKDLDLEDIKNHLIVIGELSAECFSCHSVGINIKAKSCPNCNTLFKYVGFRRKVDGSYINNLAKEREGLVFIDFEDFKKILDKEKAKKTLDI